MHQRVSDCKATDAWLALYSTTNSGSRLLAHVEVLNQRLRPGRFEVRAAGEVGGLLQEGRVARTQLAGVDQDTAPLQGGGGEQAGRVCYAMHARDGSQPSAGEANASSMRHSVAAALR